MDLVVKNEYLSEEAKKGLMNLRQSDIDLTELFNKFLASFSTLKTEKVA